MFTFVDAVLERAAARGAREVEVYAESATSRRVKVYQREVEQLTAAQRRGLGVRVFRDGAVGYAYTSGSRRLRLGRCRAPRHRPCRGQ